MSFRSLVGVVAHALLSATAAADSAVASTPLRVVQLDKQHVPIKVNGRVVAHKTAYFGNISVAYPHPQNFTVVFDTGSAHVFLPSTKCADASCLKHRRYDRSASSTAVDIDHEGTEVFPGDTRRDQVSITYGTGDIIGEFSRELICLGGAPWSPTASEQPHCVRARLIQARQMTEEPFGSFAFDGVLGLGLEALALHPEFSFFGQMMRSKDLSPVFGVFLSHEDQVPSEISFGGIDEAKIREPLSWIPVTAREQGYWQIKVHSVRVGDELLDICAAGDCTAILDTGTSVLGVPRESVQALNWKLARMLDKDTAARDDLDCRQHPGPPLVFDLGGFSITVGPDEYSRPASMSYFNNDTQSMQSLCRASLLPVQMPHIGPRVFLMGEPVLRTYYTAYDAQQQRIGFAAAVQPSNSVPAVIV